MWALGGWGSAGVWRVVCAEWRLCVCSVCLDGVCACLAGPVG